MTDDKAARLAAIRAANKTAAQQAPGVPLVAAPVAQSASAPNESGPALSFVLLILSASAGGAFLATVLVPWAFPALADSLLGPSPKAYWYLSRSSAFIAYILVWLSMVFGLLMTNKLGRMWPGGPMAFTLHQHTSLLGIGFALFHALILLGDQYIGYTLLQIAVPFASASYQPVWVGLGQVALYALALVGMSFYAKPLIGRTAWRAIHFLSFMLFVLALVHGIASGSDSGMPWAQGLYWASGLSVFWLAVYRFAATAASPKPKLQSIAQSER